MTCTRFKTQIALYAGGDLAREEVGAVETHLARCPACRRLADRLREQRHTLTGLRADVPSDAAMEDARRHVLAAIARGDGRMSWAERLWVYVSAHPVWRTAAVAAAALLVGAVWLWLPRSQTASTQTQAEPAPIVARHTASPSASGGAISTVTRPSSGETRSPAAERVSTPRPDPRPLADRDTRPRPAEASPGTRTPTDRAERDAALQTPPARASADTTPSSTAPLVRRIEWQTADPNIRIIWLVQEPAPPGRSGDPGRTRDTSADMLENRSVR